jgi:hypothetical protein
MSIIGPAIFIQLAEDVTQGKESEDVGQLSGVHLSLIGKYLDMDATFTGIGIERVDYVCDPSSDDGIDSRLLEKTCIGVESLSVRWHESR